MLREFLAETNLIVGLVLSLSLSALADDSLFRAFENAQPIDAHSVQCDAFRVALREADELASNGAELSEFQIRQIEPSLSIAFAEELPTGDGSAGPESDGALIEELLPHGTGPQPESEVEDSGEEDETEEEIEELETFLGEPWHQCGPVAVEYCYIFEGFNNTRGGISTKGATRYRGNVDLGLRLDTAAANWWEGGEFYVYMQQDHGETLTADFVGDGQFYSNIDTSPKSNDLTQLGEYWYQHSFADDSLMIRIGRNTPNNDFAFADTSCDFLNSSYATLPNIPMPYWPFQTVGMTTLYHPNEKWRLGGGFYDNGRDVAQWWATTASRGIFFIGQADYYPFADCEEAPFTLLRGGAWYTTSDTEAVDASDTFGGNFGFYTTVDRTLFSERDDAAQGLGAFFQYSWAPGDRNMVDHGIGAGLVYTGLVEGREIDTCGCGFTVIHFSSELRAVTGQASSENTVEAFYKIRLNDWLSIVPDLQYIARPSGLYQDAMVAGVRCEIVL